MMAHQNLVELNVHDITLETNPDGSVSYQKAFDFLREALPFAEALIISALPRGGMQIVQPAEVADRLRKAYGRDFHAEDRLTWQAIQQNHPIRAPEAWAEGQWEASRFYRELLQPSGLQHAVAVPLHAPLLEGYPGALHLYRTVAQGEVTDADLELLAEVGRRLDEQARQVRQHRFGTACPPSYRFWAHRPAARYLVFNGHAIQQAPTSDVSDLDTRLHEELVKHTQVRLSHLNGEHVVTDRVQLPDSKGDLWTFRVVVHRRYPALGEGPFVFFALQPECCDWNNLRPNDVQADEELARLVPAIRFMQQEFRRSPTLSEIARTVHLSPFHFHRRFTELVGLTPKHFLLECQINEAKQQMMAGDKDLAAIAKECGFAHQSHFTSRFKQATGLTPTRWRRMVLDRQKVSPN